MHVKSSLIRFPHWVRFFLLVLSVVTVLALVTAGSVGYRQGQQQAIAHRSEALANLRGQLETRIQAGDLPVAVQIGEYLELLGVLQEAERRNVQRLRELQTTQAPVDTVDTTRETLPLPVPIQWDHALWQAALSAHARAEWPVVIEHLKELKQVDRKYVTIPYMELLEDAYVQWARSLAIGHMEEEAITLLEVALALRQSEVVQRELQAAHRLVESQSFWGVDWPRVFEALDWIYRYDPSYPGLLERLDQAFTQYEAGSLYRGAACEAFLYLSGAQMKALLAKLGQESISTQLRKACEAATR